MASHGELRQALACGFVPDRVVFDSPIKTPAELRFALRAGVRLNLDNLQVSVRWGCGETRPMGKESVCVWHVYHCWSERRATVVHAELRTPYSVRQPLDMVRSCKGQVRRRKGCCS